MQQSQIIAGDSLRFARTVQDYSPADGWVLHYRLVPRSAAGQPITFDAVADGGQFLLTVDAATTAAWAAGAYGWAAWVKRGGESHTVDSGQVQVLPDPRQVAAGADTRSPARRALDDARAALAAWNPTRRRYRIGGREMEFQATADIIKLITWWEQQVKAEEQLAGRAERVGRRIHSRI